MSDYQSIQISSFVKGVNASSSKTNQPQGSVPRASNLLLTRRGSLVTCDGSQIVHAFNGVPTANRGRILVALLFAPTGVPSYYLMLASALDMPIGHPTNLTIATVAGGTLPASTYYYKVTALDGVGGETTASNEVSIVTAANGKNTLTWNVVPNAASYKVYRGLAPNGESPLTSSILPVTQPSSGTLTASFIDDGSATVLNVAATATWFRFSHAGVISTTIDIVTSSPSNLTVGQPVTASGWAPPFINGNYTVASVINSTEFTVLLADNIDHSSGTGAAGNITASSPPPIIDNTQQIVLFKLPLIPGSIAHLPISYNNSNIVALFPASLHTVSSPNSGGGGTGGGGTSGGGTGGGSGGSGQGGRPINIL